ncbi:MAG: hypothetical protein INR70_00455 [Parafilimonas terrae]|nr:hypothetical protein [Parafilimonas terrae]
MNRLAVVLAADSATTVTHWGPAGKEERYFKGANKIFQLSNHRPIGLMIFDSADMLSVPWELIVKEFRQELGAKSFNSVASYAEEFFDFIENNLMLFPEKIQKEVFFNAARTAAYQLLFLPNLGDSATDDERRAAADAAIVSQRELVAAIGFPACLDESRLRVAIAAHRDEIIADFEDQKESLGKYFPSNLEELIDLAIEFVYKMPFSYLGNTGLVFAGFGDNDIFPSMHEYKSCGLLLGKHVAEEKSSSAIDHSLPAWLGAFAQTAMSDTFSLGLSEDIYNSLMQTLADELPDFARSVCGAAGVPAENVPDVSAIVRAAAQRMGDRVLDRAKQDHAFPLRRVLGVLPIEEMAELAETLINLQSLKEKVTKPSETVGGPVDVAVITRSEGLLWIRRKHFFDPALNSRYIQRQASAYR